jgi:hypothetical protein
MTAIHETAYPRTRSNLSDQELEALYPPSPDDLAFIHRATQSPVAAFGGVILLKTFQRLGYFPHFDGLPPRLIQHLATVLGGVLPREAVQHYEQRRLREWHIPQIRTHCGITAFRDGGRRVLLAALIEAAQSKDIIADILTMGIEALVKARYELPAFSTLRRAAQKARAQVNHRYYHQVSTALDDTQRLAVTRLLSREDHEATRPWQQLKREPKQPTLKHLREHLAHVRWLQSLNTARQALQGIPETKLQRFADEAQTMDASRLKATQQSKPLTLAVALIRVRTAQALDDLADMLIRRMQQLHHQGQEALKEYRDQHQEQIEALIALLGQLVSDWQANETPEQRLIALTTRIGDDAETICAQCEAHMGYAGNNYLPFLPALFRSHRKTCLDVLAFLHPTSTSADTALARAMALVLGHRETRAERLPVPARAQGAAEALDLSWVPVGWWKAVTGRARRDGPILTVDRRDLELWVLSCAVSELKSGDLYIEGSERFSDYRDQVVTWEEYAQPIETYCQQVGIAADPAQCIADLQAQLTEAIRTTDAAFPTNTSLTITNGEPRLRRLEKLPEPEGFALMDQLLSERLPERTIVDVLTDTEHW